MTATPPEPPAGPVLPSYHLEVDGRSHSVDEAEVAESLLAVLRERLGLRGPVKQSCGTGHCGGCGVLVDGELRLACLTLAVTASGRPIRTVAGLGGGEPPDVARAFASVGAVQCGLCTPGAVLAAEVLLAADPDPDDATIRAGLSGVTCRCGGHGRLVAGVRAVARARNGAAAGEAGST